MEARVSIPADPDQRRKLWREWIHTDAPQAPQIVRRIPNTAKESDWLPEVIDAPTGIVHGLKNAIRECIIGGTLSITYRERLIARSIRLGLSRFEANLLIAAVQNRCRETAFVHATPPRRSTWGLGKTLALALFAELALGFAFWAVLFR